MDANSWHKRQLWAAQQPAKGEFWESEEEPPMPPRALGGLQVAPLLSNAQTLRPTTLAEPHTKTKACDFKACFASSNPPESCISMPKAAKQKNQIKRRF